MTEPTARACPRCKVGLVAEDRNGMVVDGCPACGGTWFDAGELTAVLGVSRAVSFDGAAATGRACVRCPNAELVDTTYPVGNTPVAACPACRGMWFEGPDLARVAASLGVVLR